MPIPEPITIARSACTALIGQPDMALGLHVEWRMMDGVRVRVTLWLKAGSSCSQGHFPARKAKKKKKEERVAEQADTKGE